MRAHELLLLIEAESLLERAEFGVLILLVSVVSAWWQS
jgi:hypothetical protein